jgi:hypothetical protein
VAARQQPLIFAALPLTALDTFRVRLFRRDMDKLASWPKGVARALLAGLLAWALVLQGPAAARFVDGAAFSAALDRCAAGGDHRHSPGDETSCSCCLPCRSDAPSPLAAIPPGTVGVFSRIAAAMRADRPSPAAAPAPAGWIVSWSQRAPPRA